MEQAEEEGWEEHEYGHDDEMVRLGNPNVSPGAACQPVYLGGGGRERESRVPASPL